MHGEWSTKETVRRLRKHPIVTTDKQNVTGDAADIIELLTEQLHLANIDCVNSDVTISVMLEALENIENDNKHMPNTAWQMIQDAIAHAKGDKT